MLNETILHRIVKLLAISFAINEEKLWQEYLKVGSVDKLIQMIEQKEIQ